jgi:hypothetical protein
VRSLPAKTLRSVALLRSHALTAVVLPAVQITRIDATGCDGRRVSQQKVAPVLTSVIVIRAKANESFSAGAALA